MSVRRIVQRLFIVICVLLAVSAEADHGRILKRKNAVTDRYIVVFKNAAVQRPNIVAAAHELAARVGATIPQNAQGEELLQWTVKGFVATMSDAAAAAIADDPRVEYVEQDAYAAVSSVSPRSLLEIDPIGDFRRWNLDRIDETHAVYGIPWAGNKQYAFGSDGTGV